ncbi:MAG TPA: hypothetical protein VGM29_05685 [Polyangiaceae bacterium]
MPVTAASTRRGIHALRVVLAGALCLLPARAEATPSKDECIDANEAAQQFKKTGALGAARAKLAVCLDEQCPGPVRHDCVELMQAVTAAMPTVVLDASDAHGATLRDVHVTVDGQPLLDHLDGSAIELDPGEHSFKFEAPGQPIDTETVQIVAGQKAQRVHGNLADRRVMAVRTIGATTAGFGMVALLVGAYQGLHAKSLYDDARAHCPHGSSSCDAQGVQGGVDAHNEASSSTIAFVLGGALLAGGAVLYVSAPKFAVAVAPAPLAGGAKLELKAVW